jgi:hypothetical protein
VWREAFKSTRHTTHPDIGVLVEIELAENDHEMRRNFNQPLALSGCQDATGLQR